MATRPGWIKKTEVVRVRFDPKVVSYAELVKHAAKRSCARPVVTRNGAQQDIASKIVGKIARRDDTAIRWVKDDKYYLSRTLLRHLPLTRIQATRINAALKGGGRVKDGVRWLSPRQRDMLAFVQRHPDVGWPSLIGIAVRPSWKRFLQKKGAVVAATRTNK